MNIILNKRILKSVSEYCKTNNLDINEYLNDLIEKAHVSHVYGEQPAFIKPKEEKKVLETENNDVFLEKGTEKPSEYSVNEGGIKVVEINKKPKIRTLKNN